MRLQLILASAAAAALCSGAAMAQTADPSNSTIPPTNDPTTRTDDQCGAHQGPRPCGQGQQEITVSTEKGDYQESYSEPMPADDYSASDTSTTTQYAPAPVSPEIRTTLVTNGPVPDTPENRARFGGPDSNGGQNTRPVGNVP